MDSYSYMTVFIVTAIFKDVLNVFAEDTGSNPGIWMRCSDKLYIVGTMNQTYNEALSYCKGLTSSLVASEGIPTYCPQLLDGQDYWIRIKNKTEGQTEQCPVFKRKSGNETIAKIPCSGSAVAICEATHVPEFKWIPFNNVQYNISVWQFGYDGCVEYCANISSHLAQNSTANPAQLLRKILDKNKMYWINITTIVSSGSNNKTCSMFMFCPNCSRVGFEAFSLYCSMKSYCICEKAFSKDQTVSDHHRIRQTIGHQEYYINYEKKTYTSSVRNCNRTVNASLATFSNIETYFQIFPQLKLRNDSFWIGVPNIDEKSSTDLCPSYNESAKTISVSLCTNEKFSICRRSLFKVTPGDVLEDKAFKTMLEEMTVQKVQTSKNKRKVTSAADERLSSKALGIVSAIILCTVFLLIVMMDLPRLR